MTRLSAMEIGNKAALYGKLTGPGLVNAIAVALAESGGDTNAVHVNRDGSRDRGLWQINSKYHPEVTDAQAFDPNQAAVAAARISKAGVDWSPWATWPIQAGARIPEARIAVSQLDGLLGTNNSGAGSQDRDTNTRKAGDPPSRLDNLVDAVTAPVKPLIVATTLAVKVGAWMADPHNWVRVAMVGGGVVGVMIALRMIAEAGGAGGAVDTLAAPARVATKAAKVAVTKGAVK